MMHDDRIGALLRLEHEILADADSDRLRLQQLDDLHSIFQTRACSISKAESAAAISLAEKLADLVGVFAAKAQLLPHAFVPKLGQSFGGFDAEAVEEEIFLVLVRLE